MAESEHSSGPAADGQGGGRTGLSELVVAGGGASGQGASDPRASGGPDITGHDASGRDTPGQTIGGQAVSGQSAGGQAAEVWLDELRAAMMFLTRLPVRIRGSVTADLQPRGMTWFPLVGAFLGLVVGATYLVGHLIGLPPMLSALVAIAVLVAVTGALHEDGLADVADGFGGGGSAEEKIAIMRDSRVGSFGVVALVLSIAVRAAALGALERPLAVVTAAIIAATLSRTALVVVARWSRPAGAGGPGLAAGFGRPTLQRTLMAVLLGLVIPYLMVVLGGSALVPVVAAAAVAVWGVLFLAKRQIGGHTGDVLGAVQQAVETAVLLVLVAWR